MGPKISFPAILFLFFILSQQILKSQSYNDAKNSQEIKLEFNTTNRVASNEEAYCRNSFVSSSKFISLSEIGFEPGHLKVPTLYLFQNMRSDASEGETQVALRSGQKNFEFIPYVVVSLKSLHCEKLIQSFTVTNVFSVFTIGACTLIEAVNDLLDCDNSSYNDLKIHFKAVASSKNFLTSYSLKAAFSNKNTISLANSIPKEPNCIAIGNPMNLKEVLNPCLTPIVKYIFLDERERLSCSMYKPNKRYERILSLDDTSKKFSLFTNYYANSILQILKDSLNSSFIGTTIVSSTDRIYFRDTSNKTNFFFLLKSNTVYSGVLKVCAKFSSINPSNPLTSATLKLIVHTAGRRVGVLGSSYKEMLDESIGNSQPFTSTLCTTFSVCDLADIVKEDFNNQGVIYEFLIHQHNNLLPPNSSVNIYTKFSRVIIDLDDQENYPIFIPGTLCTFSKCYSARGSNFKTIKAPSSIVRYKNGIQCKEKITGVNIDAEGFRLQKLPGRLTRNSVIELCGSLENVAKHNGSAGTESLMQLVKVPSKNNSSDHLPSFVTTSQNTWDCDISGLDRNGAMCIKKMKRHVIDIINCCLIHSELLNSAFSISDQLTFFKSSFQCLNGTESEKLRDIDSNFKKKAPFLNNFIDKIENWRNYSGKSSTRTNCACAGTDFSSLSEYINSICGDTISSENCSSTLDDMANKLNEKSKSLTTTLKKVELCEANFTTVNAERMFCNELLNETVGKLNSCNTSLQKRKAINSCQGELTKTEKELQNCRFNLQSKNNKLETCDNNYKNATANRESCEALLNETKTDFSNSKKALNATIINLQKCDTEQRNTLDIVTECKKKLNFAWSDNETCNTRNKDLSNNLEECHVSLTHCKQNNTTLSFEIEKTKDNYITVDNEREKLKLEMKQINEKINDLLLIHGISPSNNATLYSKLEELTQSSRERENALQKKANELIQSKNEIKKISVALRDANEEKKKNSEECKAKLKIHKKLKATEKEVKELTAELESMQETKKNISSQIKTSEDTIQQLTAHLENVEQAKVNVSYQVKTNEDEVEKLLVMLRAVKQNKTNIMTQVETSEVEAEKLIAKREVVKQSNANITSQVATSEEKRRNLLSRLQAVNQNNTNVTSQIEMSEEESMNLLTKLQNIQKNNTRISTQITTGEQATKQLIANLQSIEETKNNVSSQIKTTEDVIKQLTTDLQMVEQDKSNISSQLKTNEDEVEKLLTKLQAVKQNNTNIMTQVETSELETEKLIAKLEAINQSNTNITSQVDVSEQEGRNLLAKLQAVNQNNTNITSHVEMSEEESLKFLTKLQDIQKNNTRISTQITTGQQTIDKLIADLENVKEAKMSISNQIKTNEDVIKQLTTDLQATEQTKINILSEVKATEDESRKLLDKLQSAKQKKTNITIQTKACEDALKQVTVDLQTAENAKMDISNELEKWKKKSEKLTTSLLSFDKSNQQLSDDLKESDEKNKDLLAKLAVAEQLKQNISNELEEWKKQNDKLLDDLLNAEQAKNNVSTNLKASEDKNKDLLAKLSIAQQSKQNISNDLEQWKKQNGELLTNLSSTQQATDNVSAYLETSVNRIRQLLDDLKNGEQDKMDLSNQLEACKKQNNKLLADLHNVEQTKDNVSTNLKASEDEKKDLLARLSIAEQSKQNISNELEQWKTQNFELLANLSSVQQAKDNVSVYLETSENEIKRLLADLENVEQDKVNVSNELEDREKQNDKLLADILDVEQAKNNVSSNLKACEDRIKDLLNRVTVVEQSKKNISEEFEEWKKQKDKLLADLLNVEQARNNASINLKASEDKNKDLLAELSIAEQLRQNISNELEEWKKQNGELLANLSNIQRNENNVSTHLKTCENKNKKLLARLTVVEESNEIVSVDCEANKNKTKKLLADIKNIEQDKMNVFNQHEELKKQNDKLLANLHNVEQAKNEVFSCLNTCKNGNNDLLAKLIVAEQSKKNISDELEEWKKQNDELLTNLSNIQQNKDNVSTYFKACENRNEELLARLTVDKKSNEIVPMDCESSENEIRKLLADLKNVEQDKMNISNQLEEWKGENERLTAILLNLNQTNQQILGDLETSRKNLVMLVCENFDAWNSQEEYNKCLSQNPLQYLKALDQAVATSDKGLVANGKYYPKGLLCHEVCSSFNSTNNNTVTKATSNDTLCAQNLHECYEARSTCVMKMFQQQVKLQHYLDSNDTKVSQDLTCDPMYNMHIELLKFLYKHMNLISSCVLNQYNDFQEFSSFPTKYVPFTNDSVGHLVGSEKDNQDILSPALPKSQNDRKNINEHEISTEKKQFLQEVSILNSLLDKLLSEHTLTSSQNQNAQISTKIHVNNNLESGSSRTSNVNLNTSLSLKYNVNKPVQKIPSGWCTEEGKKNPRVAKAIELFEILPENYNFLKKNAALLSRLFESDDLEKAVNVLSEPQNFTISTKKNTNADVSTSQTMSSIEEKGDLENPSVKQLQQTSTQPIITQLNATKGEAGHFKDAKIIQPDAQNTQTSNQPLSEAKKSEDMMPEKKTHFDNKNIQPTNNKMSQDMFANINKSIPVMEEPNTTTKLPQIVESIVNESLNEKENTKNSEGENTSSRATNVNRLALVATGSLFVVGAVSALSWYLWSKKDHTTQDALGLQASESMYDWDDQLDDISALQ